MRPHGPACRWPPAAIFKERCSFPGFKDQQRGTKLPCCLLLKTSFGRGLRGRTARDPRGLQGAGPRDRTCQDTSPGLQKAGTLRHGSASREGALRAAATPPPAQAQTHLVHVQLLLELLLVLLQELLVLLLDDQVLQRRRVLRQRGRLRAPQRAVLPQLVHRRRHALRSHQRLRVQGQCAQA